MFHGIQTVHLSFPVEPSRDPGTATIYVRSAISSAAQWEKAAVDICIIFACDTTR